MDSEVRYKMNTKERKQYFKEYYLKSKEVKKDKKPKEGNSITSQNVKKRGRPKKIAPLFKITRFDEPIRLDW